MAGGVCSINPIARNGGKISKLYKEILKKTNGDRKLTNFLYSVSRTPTFLDKIDNDSINALGEVKYEKLDELLGISELIDDKAKLKLEEVNFGGILDSFGEYLELDATSDLIDRIIRYNTNNENYRASLVYNKNTKKYTVLIDIVNSTNFNNNAEYNAKLEGWNLLLNTLERTGCSINITGNAALYFNPLYASGIASMIQNIVNLKGEMPIRLNDVEILLMLDLLDNGNYRISSNLKSKYGNDTIARIKEALTEHPENPILTEDERSSILGDVINMINVLNNRFRNTNIYGSVVDKINTSLLENSETFKETKLIDIASTLDLLNEKCKINADIKTPIKNLKKISQAAEKLVNIYKRKIQIENKKAHLRTTADLKRIIKELENLVEGGDSLEAISKSLSAIMTDMSVLLDNIKLSVGRLQDMKEELQAGNFNRFDLFILNDLSKTLKNFEDLQSAIIDVLTKISLKRLDLDVDVSNTAFLGTIDDLARTAKVMLDSILDTKDTVTDTKDTVMAILLMNHFKGREVEVNGEKSSIEDLMNAVSMDMNILDRFLYSPTDTSNTIVNVVMEYIKESKRRRDLRTLEDRRHIANITLELYNAGYDTTFMYEKDENSIPTGKIISNWDWQKFELDKEKAFKEIESDTSLTSRLKKNAKKRWLAEHTQVISGINESILHFSLGVETNSESVFSMTVPSEEYRNNAYDNLNEVLKEYFLSIMKLKINRGQLVGLVLDLFDCVLISKPLSESTGSIVKNAINHLKDIYKVREDDIDYGDLLEENGIIQSSADLAGHELKTLPIFFTHKLKNRERLSMDFSRGMVAFCGAANQYSELSRIADTILVAQDWILNHEVNAEKGGNILVDIVKDKNNFALNLVTNTANNTAAFLNDAVDRNLFNRRRNLSGLDGKKIPILGMTIDKFTDVLTLYSSILGLSFNLLGAQANLLVGKYQMLIEGFGGEFFKMKDVAWASAQYDMLIWELIAELGSNNIKSKLRVLGLYFNVSDDFFDKCMSDEFRKSLTGKLYTKTELTMMYGLGEHMLHFLTMLAVLHAKKCYHKKEDGTIEEVSLWDALEIEEDGFLGKLSITGDKERLKTPPVVGDETLSESMENEYKTGYYADKDCTERLDVNSTEGFLDQVRREIAYCNRTMHGAFGTDERGMIHQYAFGRLIMNFRQWMPAHYGRRFRGRHYDAELRLWREGYYITSYNFIKECITGLKDKNVKIVEVWDLLDDGLKANIRRTIAEVGMLTILNALCALLYGLKDSDDWWKRNLIYQLKRIQLEEVSSVPIPTLFSGYGATGFMNASLTILNSPMACISTVEKLGTLLDFSLLTEEVKTGENKGDNKYVRNMIKLIPIVGQYKKWSKLTVSNNMFNKFSSNKDIMGLSMLGIDEE